MRTILRIVPPFVVGTILGVLLDGHAPLGSLLYAPFAGAPQPTGAALRVLMASVVAQAFGLGIALVLLVHARPTVRGLARVARGSVALGVASFVSLEWLLASWVPHGSLHQHLDPTNFWGVAAVEWGFHVSLVAAGAILARLAWVAAAATTEPAGAQARSPALVPAPR